MLVDCMVLNATFNNISDISWRSVFWWRKPDKLYHIMLYRVHLAWAGFELTTLVVICTDCIGSYKSNYHTITTAPLSKYTNVFLYTILYITIIYFYSKCWTEINCIYIVSVVLQQHLEVDSLSRAPNWSLLEEARKFGCL